MQIFGLHFWKGKYEDFFDMIKNPEKATLVFTPNPEILVRAHRDESFMQILKKATYLVPDGTGLYVASEMQKGKGFYPSGWKIFRDKNYAKKTYGELIKGSELTHDLTYYAEESGKKILIIDNYRITKPENAFEIKKQKIQKEMKSLLQKRFPKLALEVFFLADMSSDAIAHYIEVNHISYVFACTGMKSQEQLLVDIFSYLPDATQVVGLGVGSSFDYLIGLQKRAPHIVRSMGMEWLYRLILEPRKRYKRIHTAFVEFPRFISLSKK